MLPAKNRLKGRKEFNDLFRIGKIFSDEQLLAKVAPREDEKPTQFGFGASLKFSKQATKRNRAKRLMRQAVRERLKEIVSGWQVIFLIKPDCPKEKINLESIRKSVDLLLKKAKILKNT